MFRFQFFVVALSFVPLIGLGQKEDFNWLMGGLIAPDSLEAMFKIDFSYSPPLMEYIPEFSGLYMTNANISDKEGNLLLYTNGVHVYDADHNIIENGQAFQLPNWYPIGYHLIQGAIILPYPGQPDKYMFILCDDTNYTNGSGFIVHGCYPLNYSLIEKTSAGWSVTEKKTPVSADTVHYNQLQGIQHANGRDWWLVSAPYLGTNRYHKFLLDPSGISKQDVQYFADPYWKAWGQGAVSPNGEWIAYYNLSADGSPNYAFYVELFRFDRCSGELGGHVQMIYPQEGATGGIAFSPDSKLLYVADRTEIFQFDLEAADIMASRTLVAEYDGFLDEWGAPAGFGLMKLAPDGKIYICSTTIGTQYMHVIEQPNVLGAGCDMRQHSVFLPARNNRSLPHHPTFRLGPVEGSPCDTLDFTPVSEAKMDKVARVLPNPATKVGGFQIEMDIRENLPVEIIFYDALGKKVLNLHLPTNGMYHQSLEGFVSGLYFYEVLADGKRVDLGKLVVSEH